MKARKVAVNGQLTLSAPDRLRSEGIRRLAFAFAFVAGLALGAGAAPVVGELTVKSVGDSYAEIEVPISDLGDDATRASVTFNYGEDAASLDKTYAPAASVTTTGTATLTLRRLLPEHTYFVTATVTNDKDESVTSASISLTTLESPDNASGLPGLYQTVFTSANGDWTKDYTTVSEGTDWTSYTDTNRIYRRELGAIAAYATGSQKYTSEIWKDQIYWKADQLQWCYWGYMQMKKGTNYKFRAKIDDCTYLAVTDPQTNTKTVLINDKTYSTADVSETYTPTTTGWYPIEIRLSDGSGGKGGCDTSSSCKNSVNLGYSADNGSTWNLMLDDGTGALFRTSGSSVEITATERVASGNLTLALSFAEADTDRTLAVVWGPQHGGETTNGWAHAEVLGTVAAGETKYSYPMPSTWGDDDCLVARFCFVADDAAPVWSNSTYWRDLGEPVVSDVETEGLGGDTLVVKGNLALAQAGACTLSVLTGASADALTQTWTGLDGATLSSSGAFTLTLCEANVASARYLKPGETYYVQVVATGANGKSARSTVVEAKMSGAAAWTAKSASVSRRTVTFTGQLASVGMSGATEVTLWAGTAEDEETFAQVEGPITVTSTSSFTIKHTFPSFDTTYYWQLRASNASQGGTTNLVKRTWVGSVQTLDTTTYAWTGAANDGAWENPENWDDGCGGDSLGYPQSAAASVRFPAGETRVVVKASRTFANLSVAAADARVTLVADASAATRPTLTVSNLLTLSSVRGALTLDGVALVANNNNVTLGANFALSLENASYLKVAKSLCNNQFGTISLAGGSGIYANASECAAGTIVIDDSAYTNATGLAFGATGATRVDFLGAGPRLLAKYVAAPNSSAWTTRFTFSVPAGGYALAPVASLSSDYLLGNSQGTARAGQIALDVAADSPARATDGVTTTTLVSWNAKGVKTATVVSGELNADASLSSSADECFTWDAANTPPRTVSVTLCGTTGANLLTVVGSPTAVASDALSPAYGQHAVARGATQTCTAPADAITLAEGVRRARCVGWKLYAVDAATRKRTFVGSGDGTTVDYVNEDGAWHELAWQWKVERKVTATADGHGTVAVNGASGEAWVEEGTLCRVTPTPAEGYGFGKWTGDALPEEHDKDHELAFVVRDQAYAFAASFLPKVYVDPAAGDDANDGQTKATAKKTISSALALATDDAGVYVSLADGVYEVTNQIAVATGSTVAGEGDGAVVRMMKAFTTTATTYYLPEISLFRLTHADARLYRLTITTDYKKGDTSKNAYGQQRNASFGRGVYLTAGLVDRCTVTNCFIGSWLSTRRALGAGVDLHGGGVVRNSLLTHNSISVGDGDGLTGINARLVDGGLVENCRIVCAAVGLSASRIAAGVYIEGAGTVRNSLVAQNTGAGNFSWYHFRASGVEMGSSQNTSCGTLENCTVVGNKISSVDCPGVRAIGKSSSKCTIRNCIIRENRDDRAEVNFRDKTVYNTSNGNNGSSDNYTMTKTCVSDMFVVADGNTSADPMFVDSANGDWRCGYSAVVDAAAKADWMDWTTDLGGQLRVQGDAPDMGCYEYAAASLNASFTATAAGSLDSDDLTLAATVDGEDLRGLSYAWTITNTKTGEKTEKTVADATTVVTLPAGVYDIALVVSNGTGATATQTRKSVAAVSPSNVYVSPGGSGTYPYASYATGATDLQTAYEVVGAGGVVHVAAGWYTLAQTLSLKKKVTVVSEEGPEKTTLCYMGGTVVSLVVDSTLSGFTVSGFSQDGTKRVNASSSRLSVSAGVVTNCVVSGGHAKGGGALLIASGTVVDCVFTNNYSTFGGGAIRAGGSGKVLVDRCTFVGNGAGEKGAWIDRGATPMVGGGIDVNNGTWTIRNSLFVGNVAWKGGAVSVESSGAATVAHCTFVGNTLTEGAVGPAYADTTGNSKLVVADCILSRNTDAAGNLYDLDEWFFADAAAGDYRPTAASLAVDAATGTEHGDYDLDGQARVSGAAADLGCYEVDQSRLSVAIRYEKLSDFAPGPVKFTAKATGAALADDACYWTFDGTEPSAVNFAAKGAVVTVTLDPGSVTARFKTTIGASTYLVEHANWFEFVGETVYVVKANANAAYPYATWETAATDLAAAFNVVQAGGTLMLGDGAWTNATLPKIDKKMTVTSRNGPERTSLQKSATNTQTPMVTLAHRDAVVSGLTFRNCRGKPGAVSLSAGRVENCVFDACGGYGDCGGQGAVISCWNASAVVDRCVVTGAVRGDGKENGAIYVSGGVVRNTVVANGRLSNSGTSYGKCAGIYATGAAKVENCTVVGNALLREASATDVAAGVYVASTNVSVVNTIAWSNTWNEAASDLGGVDGCASCVTTSLVDGTNPQFRSGAAAWRPTSSSPCVNAGTELDWMTEGALDVYGKARLMGGRPDIGAAETTGGTGFLLFLR